MRLVVQKVIRSQVSVGGEVVGKIGRGLNVLIGVCNDDNENDVHYLAEKAFGLRIFKDENDKTNLSIADVNETEKGLGILCISQFTLYGDVRKGKRPAFSEAAPEDKARALYELFVSEIRKLAEPIGISVETGIFREHMEVEIINDGPFTILLDSKKTF